MSATNQRSSERCPVVGVGSSAGGLEAINAMMAGVKKDTALAYVLVPHLDPNHQSMMVDLVSRRTELAVHQIEGGETVRAGNLYIIPPGFSLRISNGTLHLSRFSEPRGLRRPIDDFFKSLAEDQTSRAACVILSGTGADGSSGLRAVKEHGGICVTQDPRTAQYDGMPMAAVGTGLVDFILAPDQIAERLEDYFQRHRDVDEAEEAASFIAEHIDEMCATLRRVVGHDFSGYKRTTLSRRIARRMQVLAITEARDYAQRLSADTSECDALFRDLLINVTSFFRDANMFDALRRRSIEPIVANGNAGQAVRVWVAGCSSGEEAYTVAILFAEAMRKTGKRLTIQIFATDIDPQMLSVAREGRYPSSALGDIPEPLRNDYTIGLDGSFVFVPPIRDMIHFSCHSLIKDPPFSKLDLISCRNLLIYLGDEIQRSVMPLLHYALRQGGMLFLGPSESLGRSDDLFETIDQKNRIFKKAGGDVAYPFTMPVSADVAPVKRSAPAKPQNATVIQNFEMSALEQRLLQRYAPAGVLVDASGEVLSASGRLSKYLDMPAGKPTNHILDLARPGLKESLGPLLREVAQSGKRAALENVEARSEFGTQNFHLVVDPLADGTLAVVFREDGSFKQDISDDFIELDEPVDRVRDLEEELRVSRFRLRSTVEELETANEELKSSNEEMMSMNEELQSANEELATVNEELKNKVDQLSLASDDMNNFLTSTHIALLVVDRNFAIKSFTNSITDIFPINSGDKGRQLSEFAPLVSDTDMIEDAKRVLAGERAMTRTVSRRDGSATYTMRILPYTSLEKRVDGVTFTFADITELLETQSELSRQSARLALALGASGMGVFEMETETGLATVDDTLREVVGFAPDEEVTLDRFLSKVHEEDREEVLSAVHNAIENDEEFRTSFRLAEESLGTRWIRAVGRLLDQPGPKTLAGVNFDITAEQEAGHTRELLLREINHRVKNLFAIISALITLAARTTDDVGELVKDVRTRINALARAHEITQGKTNADGVDLDVLIKSILAPYMDTHRIDLSGEPVKLPSEMTTPIGLIVHEWATNAVKYGALSEDGGTVGVEWSKSGVENGSNKIELIWNESGGPAVSQDARNCGFGSQLTAISAKQLNGRIENEWNRNGLKVKLVVDASE